MSDENVMGRVIRTSPTREDVLRPEAVVMAAEETTELRFLSGEVERKTSDYAGSGRR